MYTDQRQNTSRQRFRAALSLEPLERRALLSVSAVGGELHFNTHLPGEQGTVAVATDADGDFVAVWMSGGQDGSGYGIYAQRINAAGVAQGVEFRVNTYTVGNQEHPAVAMDSAGDFVVVWDSYGQDGESWGVYAQRYNAAGAPQGIEFRVNQPTSNTQTVPAVAMDSDGDFIVTWADGAPNGSPVPARDGSGYGIFAQRYNASGVAMGDDIQVNTYTAGNQFYPRIAADSAGDFVVTWHSNLQDGSGYGIYAQRFSAAGAKLGGELPVNTVTSGDQKYPSIAMDSAGDFVIAFESSDGSSIGVFARRFDSAGAPQGIPVRVNSTTANLQDAPRVAMDSTGDYVVIWESGSAQDGSGYGIYAQAYAFGGSAVGGEFPVNSTTPGNQGYPDVSMTPTGDFVAVWQSRQEPGNSYGAYGQRFHGVFDTTPPTLTGSSWVYQSQQAIVFQFSENVSASLDTNDLALVNQTTATTVPAANIALSYDAATNTATFTFPGYANGVLPDGNYRATLFGAGISDAAGNAMTGDSILSDFALAGDANHDRIVDISDLGILAANWQGSSTTFAQGDFNYDTHVDISDLGILATNWQNSLPAPASPPPAAPPLAIGPVRSPFRRLPRQGSSIDQALA